jgi:hypothetical protein
MVTCSEDDKLPFFYNLSILTENSRYKAIKLLLYERLKATYAVLFYLHIFPDKTRWWSKLHGDG